MLESDLQKYFVKLLYMVPNIFFHSIPNESKRSFYYGSHLKKMGLRSGVPDLLIIKNGRPIYIELKSKKGKLTKNQENIRDEIIKNGADYYVINCIDSIEKFLKEKLK